MGKIITEETQEILQEDSYFIDENKTIFFFLKGTKKSEYENLTPITKKEIDDMNKTQELIYYFLPYIKDYKESLLKENVEFKNHQFQADKLSLESLISTNISNIKSITWFDSSNNPIELNNEEIKELISIISDRNSDIITTKQQIVKELKECKSTFDINNWIEKYQDTLPFLKEEN